MRSNSILKHNLILFLFNFLVKNSLKLISHEKYILIIEIMELEDATYTIDCSQNLLLLIDFQLLEATKSKE